MEKVVEKFEKKSFLFSSPHAEYRIVLKSTKSMVIEGRLVPIEPGLTIEFHSHLYSTDNEEIANMLRNTQYFGRYYHEGTDYQKLVTRMTPLVGFGPRGSATVPIGAHEVSVLNEQRREDRDNGDKESNSL